MAAEMTIRLPYPPSANTLWRRAGSRIHLSEKGRAYYHDCAVAVHQQSARLGWTGPVWVRIFLFPPDGRQRDLDNSIKAIFDALQKCGVIANDRQIQTLTVRRMSRVCGGGVDVTVGQYVGQSEDE